MAQLKAQLAPNATALASSLAAVSEDTRQADMKLIEKREAMTAYDNGFSATADLISTLLKLAGEDELAKRVRLSTRRPGQTVDDAGDTSIEVEAPSEQAAVNVA